MPDKIVPDSALLPLVLKLQQYVELRDMKDVSLNYLTFSESDKDSAWEIMSPLLDR